MKKITLIALLVFSSLGVVSCSSSDDSGSSPGDDTFTYNYDGSAVTISDITASKSEETIAIVAEASNGQRIEILFDKYGTLGTVSSYSVTDFDFPERDSFIHYSSHYMTFNLVSIDQANNRVKGNFSGQLFADNEDSTSESVEVSGNFDVSYQVVTPMISGLRDYAKIGGQDWYATSGYTTGGAGGNAVYIEHELSDNEYKIMITYDEAATAVGTYNFTSSATVNNVQLAKYDTATNTYTVYNTTGTLTISEITPGMFGILAGTYSFTASNPANPSDVIQVTDGTFKMII